MKIGFISDVHEDCQNLRKAIAVLTRVKCQRIFCLGDLVGYDNKYYRFESTRNAKKVMKIIRQHCQTMVVGNHDLFAIKKVPKYSNFIFSNDWYVLSLKKRKKIAKNKVWLYVENELPSNLSDKEKRFIEKIPEYAIAKFGKLHLFLSHYAYPDLTGSSVKEVTTKNDLRQHFDFLKRKKCLISISGHDHIEGLKIITTTGSKFVPFNEQVVLPQEPSWVCVPSIAAGTNVSGVAVLDLKKYTIVSIPLN